MQANILKKSNNSLRQKACVLFLLLSFGSFANDFADSLFAKRQYTQAKEEYLKKIQNNTYNSAVLLKLAYISEQEGENVRTAYYLSLYDKKKPDEKLMKHLAALGETNKWLGYEQTDVNYLMLIYRKYASYLTVFLIILGLYVFGVLLHKQYHRQTIPVRHKIILLCYIALLALFINIPNNYRSVIINQDDAQLRSYPSSAAPVVGTLPKGYRLNWVNTDDIWLQVLWNNELSYIKQSNVLKIE